MEIMQRLSESVDVLLKRHNAVCGENILLKKQLAEAQVVEEKLRSELRETQQRLMAFEIGAALPDAESRASSRRKLDEVIRDIDKILTTLND